MFGGQLVICAACHKQVPAAAAVMRKGVPYHRACISVAEAQFAPVQRD